MHATEMFETQSVLEPRSVLYPWPLTFPILYTYLGKEELVRYLVPLFAVLLQLWRDT